MESKTGCLLVRQRSSCAKAQFEQASCLRGVEKVLAVIYLRWCPAFEIMWKTWSSAIACAFLVLLFVCPESQSASSQKSADWPAYGGGLEDIRYSPLKQINRKNVSRLQVAWTFDTGDAFRGSEFQCNPLIVDGVLYSTTPKLDVVTLNAATGTLRWRVNPAEGETGPVFVGQAPLWGLGRVIAQEHPELHCASIDLEGAI